MLVTKLDVDALRDLFNDAVYYTNNTFKRAYALDERTPALETAYKNVISLVMVLSTTPTPERVKCLSTFKVAIADMGGDRAECNKDTLLYLDAIINQMRFLDPDLKYEDWGIHIARTLIGMTTTSDLKLVVGNSENDSVYESNAIYALLLLAAYGHDLFDTMDTKQ